MSNPQMKNEQDEDAPKGPNIVLLYSLVALALAAAIGIAMMIVYPYYLHR
jgi:hypothetical protein